ncbi:alpha/beta fold hydrolase [Streptomyces canus]|uniref:alpha/beta fold hydrolase n=1 Tax=Streptomyces canus TaxID=58343 RepID=UPI00036689B0|nr:alpha/beta hydrolase [Streptomyces canus]
MNTPAGFQHRTAIVNGVRLHYVIGGSGPAVLLLHGWPQTWHEWRHVAAGLSEYTVVVPDLRGFGYSGKPESGYDGVTIASDLSELVRHLGLGDVTVVGHDWGAVFAYLLAAEHRDQVSALGVIEMALPGVGRMEAAMQPAPGGNYLWHMGFHSVPEVPEFLISGKERQYLRWFFEHFAFDPGAITAGDLDEYVAAITQVGALRAGLGVYREFFTTAEQVAERSKTPLDIPVVAWGGEASLGGLSLDSVQQVAPRATGGVIERCGHWATEERPDFVTAVIRALVPPTATATR